MIVEALKRKGVPVAYVAFEGEQHGFRQAANMRRALDSELSFYSQVLGFELPRGRSNRAGGSHARLTRPRRAAQPAVSVDELPPASMTLKRSCATGLPLRARAWR